MASPPPAVTAEVERILPDAVGVAQTRERWILKRGRALTDSEIALARRIGVQEPERVRISTVQNFRTPEPKFGGPNPSICAITSGHGIQVNSLCPRQRHILAHELTHVTQFERLGMLEFEREFLIQMILVGSTRAPLETQARENETLGD
ncbi:hypothetical protein GCM10009105_23780 [Dokdonella soli]|uniref:DUF4157 domain-containing protein n=1 Tax=Dokdonella soli TaxID=529810 RepID=A0ABN1IM99_9GAMM